MLVAIDGQAAGFLGVADPIKSSTPEAIKLLHEAGVRIVMLTGDSRATAEAVAKKLGIDSVEAEVLPEQKIATVKRLQAGGHKIDGVGAGFVVPLWHAAIADEIDRVSTGEAIAMALSLAREEGLFAGTSTGANVYAALRLAERLGPEATVVTVMCDTGMKYLRTFGG